MHTIPDHLLDSTSPPIRWAGLTESEASFVAPYDGLLKTRFTSTAPNAASLFAAANPDFAGLAASSPVANLAALVAGVPITKGTTVNLTCGETIAMQDAAVSDVLTFMPAALPVSPTSLFPAFTTTPPSTVTPS